MGFGRAWLLVREEPEFLQTDVIETFRWLRVIGDTVFAAGAIALAAFVIGLHTGGSTRIERFQARPASRYRAVSGLSDRDWCGLPRRASRGPVWCIDRAVHELTRRVNQP